MINFILNKIMERGIRSALRNKDLDKLKQWLAVADDGNFSQKNWKISFGEKDYSLVDFALTASKAHLHNYHHPRWYQTRKSIQNELFLAQDYFAAVPLCWKESKEEPKEVSLRWYQSLFLGIKNLFSIHWKFNASTAFDDEVIAEVTSRSINETVDNPMPEPSSEFSFKEKYSPETQVKKMFVEPPVTDFKDLPVDKKEKKKIIPDYWLKALSLNHQVEEAEDQRQQQYQDVAQYQEIKIDLDAKQEQDVRINLAVDNSVQLSYSAAQQRLKDPDYEMVYTQTWVKDLGEQLNVSQTSISKNKLLISEQATSVLLKGHGIVRGNEQAISLDALPLGFFIDIEDNGSDGKNYVLKFSEAYRDFQINTYPDHVMRLDPFAQGISMHTDRYTQASTHCQQHEGHSFDYFGQTVKGIVEKNIKTMEKIGEMSYLQKLADEKGIIISTAQNKFLHENAKKWQKMMKGKDLKFNPVISALSLIISQSSPEEFSALIDFLIKLNDWTLD